METIAEARQFLKDNWENGVDCPCCGRFVKLYPYNLNSNAAVSLIWIYQLGNMHQKNWVHVQRQFTEAHNRNATAMSYIILKHWGLIEPRPGNTDPSKKASGFWRITDKGINFVNGKLGVPKTVMVYKDKPRGYEGDSITIQVALGNKFDYAELMGHELPLPKAISWLKDEPIN